LPPNTRCCWRGFDIEAALLGSLAGRSYQDAPQQNAFPLGCATDRSQVRQSQALVVNRHRLESLFIAMIASACAEKPDQVPANSGVGIPDTAGARTFAQAFYDWYTPMASSGTAWAEVLKRDTLMHPILLALLRDDYAVRGSEETTRSTIDGDPFVGQDPCPPFGAKKVQQTGDRFRVTVTDDCATKRLLGATSFVLEVARNTKRWEIINVRYGPDTTTLIDYLCQYAMADKRPEKRPATCGRP
jgi:hypothetical protein